MHTGIRPLQIFQDHALMQQSVNHIVDSVGWGDKNQIALSSRPDAVDAWQDGLGRSVDPITKVKLINEADFTCLNDLSPYLLNSLQSLSETTGSKFGRIRLMRLMPHHGLSVHRDSETRLHYVIDTNRRCYFGFSQFDDPDMPAAECWHMPQDSQWYHVDTRKHHFVYNGGETPRIHIVICVLRTSLTAW